MSDFLGGIGKFISNGVNLLSGGALFDAAGNVLGLPPIITHAVKTVAALVTGNVLLAADGVMGVAKELSQNQAAFTEFVPPKDDKVACEGYAKPKGTRSTHEDSWATRGTKGSPAPGEVRPDGALDPSILEYRGALRTLEANFTLFDTVDNVKNGKFTRQTLEKVADSASMPESVRKAARFLLAHPEYRTQLDTASQKGGFVDGTFSTKDVRAALSDVETRIAKYGVRGESRGAPPLPSGTPVGTRPPGGGPTRSGPASSSVKDIINDPKMGLEEKIQAILMALTERMDGEILDTMDDLAAAQDKKAGISNEKGNEKALSDAQRDIDRITMRLQQLVEKRKMMFEMMSTMSMKFNEMAKTALSNMRSA